jgi:AraC-like DNA-binding protein/ligand-binding sensor protein
MRVGTIYRPEATMLIKVRTVKKIDQVLKNETYEDAETLKILLERITNKYDVRINLNDLAGISKINSQIEDIFSLYSYHNNSFCNYLKRNEATFSLCVKAKNKLCKAFNTIKTPFYGKCYMGVNEINYPVWFNKRLIALICIGQFSDNMEDSIELVKRKAERYGLDPVACVEEYISIAKEIDFSISDLNRDLWVVCNYMSLFYRNGILQKSIHSELSSVVRSTTDYYQNKVIISSAIDFIKTNYASKISLDLISKHCYCNPAYLSHLFNKEVGVTLTDYINGYRIERAKYLLDITDLTITQIANEVGFNNSSYFSKTFKKIQGVSPTHYRIRNV